MLFGVLALVGDPKLNRFAWLFLFLVWRFGLFCSFVFCWDFAPEGACVCGVSVQHEQSRGPAGNWMARAPTKTNVPAGTITGLGSLQGCVCFVPVEI